MDWHNFFDMDGYGLYVWGSYGITALILLWMILSTFGCKEDDA